MFNRIDLKFPRFSFRTFLFFLFGLVILVLLAEGGYYFWVQRETKGRTRNPAIVREEGVFTYIKSPDGTIQKMILGTIKGIDGNLLTIKTDNNKTAQVLFTGENIQIVDFTSGIENSGFKIGTMEDLLAGDKVRIAEISKNERQITAKFLIIVKGTIKDL